MVSEQTVKRIEKLVDEVFDKLKGRYLSPAAAGKRMVVGYARDLSLPGIYEEALIAEGGVPDIELLNTLVSSTGRYLEASKEKAKADIVRAIVAALSARAATGATDEEVAETLAETLEEQWTKVTHSVERIVDTEASQARGVGLMQGIIEQAEETGTDPMVYWVVRKDHRLCGECKRLHLMPDGVTPRVWYLSEVSHAYHVRGENFPSIGGLHPHCFTGAMRIHTSLGLLTFEELYSTQEEFDVVVDNRVKAVAGKVRFDTSDTGTRLLPSTPVYDTGVQQCYLVSLSDGKSLEVSYGHEMWVVRDRGGEKVRAASLVVGDVVPTLDGVAVVVSIEDIGPKQTYCVTQPETNTVTVNGVVTGNCRCTMVGISPGWGFDENGRIKWIKKDYNILEEQRGLSKSEELPPLEGVKHEDVCEICKHFQGVDYYNLEETP